MSKDKVIYFPYANRTFFSRNKFQNNFMDALRVSYDLVRLEAVSVDNEKLKGVKAAVFNWLEYHLDETMKSRIIFYKKCGIKIIWVFHNRLPHECSGGDEIKKMSWIADNSDVIILLSKASVKYLPGKNNERKTFYAPHPLYQVYESDCFANRKNLFSNENITIGFLGMIRPYKRIELLIKLAKEEKINLIVAGFATVPEYAEKIRESVAGADNIFFTTEKNSDRDFFFYHQQADIIALPYNTKSSMNSGSMIMAFSCAKPVLVTDIAMARDLANEAFVHIIHGETNEDIEMEFRLELKKCIAQGVEKLKEQGALARTYVENNNSLDIVAKDFKAMIG